MSSHRKTYDIVIVGGGPAGLSFACLASGAGLRLAVVESQAEASLADPVPDGRDIALTHFSIQILQETGAWGYIADADVAPIKRAYVRNAKSPISCASTKRERNGRLSSISSAIRTSAEHSIKLRKTARIWTFSPGIV